MTYGRLGSSESIPSVSDIPFESPARGTTGCRGGGGGRHGSTSSGRSRGRVALLAVFAALFLAAAGASVAFLLLSRGRNVAAAGGGALREPTHAISRTCGVTRHPGLCVSSLMQFPGALKAGERDLVHVSVNVTLQRVSKAFYGASAIANAQMNMRLRTAYEDCIELLDDSVDQLSRSLAAVTPGKKGGGASSADVLTWLSGVLTNQDTCTEGLAGAPGGYVKDQMAAHLKDLTEMVSNCLAIFAVSSKNKDFSGVPIQNKRRRLLSSTDGSDTTNLFPAWLKRRDRRLLQTPAPLIQADMVVSKDGNGTYKTIEEAVKAAPEYSPRRIIIYIKGGRYDENIKVGRKKTNLMFIGEGKSKTIIAGSRSVYDNYTTFHTATFAATGSGFIARDITFQNWAGPERHQAVALRVGADHAVVYRCNVIGYQDTLYVHSQRQFFRECDIYGTVDFIFGNAAVVLQNCSIYSRKPMDMQKNTITAQNRKDPNQNTGISIHASRILPTPDLEATKASYQTYLGRPWKLYSRAVYMMCYMADHIQPEGWLAWNATFALDTLYYGEYMNYGPGAAIGKRVTWPGYRFITLPEEASKFTVAQFIYGSSWLPSTGVAFLAGLSV